MAPPTSIAWNYFTLDEVDPTAAICHLCRKPIRIVKNTSPLIAHLRCKHPEVLHKRESGVENSELFMAELADVSTQTNPGDFPNPVKLEAEDEGKSMEYDKNLRMREMMVQRLDDAVGNMQENTNLGKYPQLVRMLVESCLWLIRDWPGQKEIEDLEPIRASRLAVQTKLLQFLRARPPRSCEMEGHMLILADAILMISEQWPEGEWDKPSPAPAPPPISAPQRVIVQQKRPHVPQPPASYVQVPVKQLPPANLRPVYGTPGPSYQQPAAKIMRIAATPQQLSNSPVNSFPQSSIQARTPYRLMPQAGNAGSPSRLWSFFTKMIGESGELLAKCNICRRLVPRQNHGTTGMKNHLKANHPQEFTALDRENSMRPESSHSSPHFISMEDDQPAAEVTEKTPQSISAIVAALNSGPSSSLSGDDTRFSPLFNEDNIKEEGVEFEEINYEEELEKYKAATASEEDSIEPSEAERAIAQITTNALQYKTKTGSTTSDIWKYFTKEDVGADKHGRCNLCDWSKKIYNHGTNIMWSHLRRLHPSEYSLLKPFEYNPAVHGEFVPAPVPGCALVPGGGLRMVPGGTVPAHQVRPRLPVQAGEDLVKEEEVL